MKWGKKKQPSAAASARPFFISQVLSNSWLAKFKQMSVNSGEKYAKAKPKAKWNSVTTNPSSYVYACSDGGKFYGGDGDAFWRLSFGDDSLDGMKSRGVLRSVWYNSEDDDDVLELQPSGCQSYRSKATRINGQEEAQKFSGMVSHARKMRGLPKEIQILPEVRTRFREKVAEIRTPRLRVEKEKKLKEGNQRVLDGSQVDAEKIPRKATAKNLYEPKPGRTGGIVHRKDFKFAAADSRKDRNIFPLNARDSYQRKIQEGFVFAAENEKGNGFAAENFSCEWQKLKERKIEEVKSRNEEQRKSLYISRDLPRKRPKQSSKVRAHSPRTASKAEICKIKALEDMKKAKLKMKKKAKEKTIEGFQGLESFAVVKCSYDPQKDFRESMIEMIKEQKISRPEELEELLACYLTLNSDEYHDLIIRVFRQVWFDLNQACFDTELELEEFQ